MVAVTDTEILQLLELEGLTGGEVAVNRPVLRWEEGSDRSQKHRNQIAGPSFGCAVRTPRLPHIETSGDGKPGAMSAE
jgi:hypothetical protein